MISGWSSLIGSALPKSASTARHTVLESAAVSSLSSLMNSFSVIPSPIVAKLKKTDGELRASLRHCNLIVKEMGADGNCLFRSISDQLYGSDYQSNLGCEDFHLEIRALCLDYVQH